MAEEKRKRGRPRKNPEAAVSLPAVDVVVVEKSKRAKDKDKEKDNGKKSKQDVTELVYKTSNAWENETFKRDQVFKFSEGYKSFLDKSKTERECIRESVTLAQAKGFKNIEDVIHANKTLNPGDKVYQIVKNKMIVLAVVGQKPAEEGTKIVGAHVDAPRIDIKQNPLYESTDMAFLKTHYYGGIKKYQWVAIPLALHGVIVKPNGTSINVNIGEDESDPIFTITDLLPHLAKDQMEKKLTEAFSGEAMNVLVGSEPLAQKDDVKDRIKLNVLKILNEKYSVEEEDLVSSELELVPAFKARDLGFDRSMIGAYGHDDRVCAYPALMSLLDVEKPEYTAVCVLTDKEEIGSVGNTGAESRALENFLADLCALTTKSSYNDRLLRNCLNKSKMLSADVNAAFDPNYEGTHDKLNAGYLGKGVAILKFSGSRGKSGASDANAEFVAEVRGLFNKHNIPWHITELGAVDKGGGGTIAMMIANLGVEVLDVGVPVLSMHAPLEVVSKIDLYAVYKGYYFFMK